MAVIDTHSTEEKLNDRQRDLAVDFYGEFMVDLFRHGEPKVKTDGFDENDYKENLLIYIESLIIIVHALQNVIMTGEVDTEEAIESSGRIRKWDPGIGSADLHDSVLRVLRELADSLYRHRHDYSRYYFGNA